VVGFVFVIRGASHHNIKAYCQLEVQRATTCGRGGGTALIGVAGHMQQWRLYICSMVAIYVYHGDVC
jgi:hypothetical protein